ncbi:MAG: hypothetical protein ABUS47_04425 [Steroidobacter sp.]
MRRLPLFSIIAAFPSALLLVYLAAHATEGWQLIVVAGFAAGFGIAWRQQSRPVLLTSYAATTLLSLWVFWANI